MSTTVDVAEAQQQLPHLLDLATAGNEVIISVGEKPVARLTAIAKPTPTNQRVGGLHQGAIWVSEDFDEPLPDTFWTDGE